MKDSTRTLNRILIEKKESFRLLVNPFPDLRVLHHLFESIKKKFYHFLISCLSVSEAYLILTMSESMSEN
jgi:hypothetical protein